MIAFMLLGAPRSGTAWAANWLTTDRTLCLHDVLFTHAPESVDELPCDRMMGLADTGLALFPEWVNAHPAKKVVLHRDPQEVNLSLSKAGFPRTLRNWARDLRKIEGANVAHVDWRVLFDKPDFIHSFLFGDTIPFDTARHAMLAKLNVQADFEKIDPDPIVTRRLLERMRMDER